MIRDYIYPIPPNPISALPVGPTVLTPSVSRMKRIVPLNVGSMFTFLKWGIVLDCSMILDADKLPVLSYENIEF